MHFFSISCCSRLHSFTNFLFLPLADAPDGSPIVEMPNSDIPVSVIHDLDELLTSGLTLEDAVTNLRGSLVPPGHEPYPFRTNTAESLLDKLRSVVATYTFRKRIEELKDRVLISHLTSMFQRLIQLQVLYTTSEVTITTF